MNIKIKDNTPPRLFTLKLLLLVLGIVLILLFALFPWKSAHYLNSQKVPVLKEQFSSRIKTFYYQMLDKNNPPAKDVLYLASLLTNKSLWEESGRLLSKKLTPKKLADDSVLEYEFVTLNNKMGKYYESQDKEERIILKYKVRQQLISLSKYDKIPDALLIKLAESSKAFGLLPLSSEFYQRLAQNNLQDKAKWYGLAGDLATQSRYDDKAVFLYKKALDTVYSKPQLRLYTEKWLSALERAGQFQQIETFLNQVKQQPEKYPKNLDIIAKKSANLGYPQIATYLFQYLAKNSSVNQQQSWYEKASHWSSVAGNDDEAINLLLEARSTVNNSNKGDQWSINQALVDLYIKGNKADKALKLILEFLKAFPNDQRLINKAVYVSLKEGKYDIARNINSGYLKANPHSLSGLLRQAKIELAGKRYNKSVFYVKKALEKYPDSLAPQKLWADIEAARDNYDFALDKWLWIYQQEKTAENRLRLIAVAQASLNKKALEVLINLAETGDLPRQAVYDVFYHLLNNDNKKQAISFLQNYLSSHKPDKALYITLAKWLSAGKEYSASLRTWKDIDKIFGASKVSSLSQFELYWLLGKKKSAYKLWLKNKKSWDKEISTRHLSIMAEIAWQYKYRKSAAAYYSRLLKRRYQRSRRVRELQYMRLSILQEDLGQNSLALSTLSQGVKKTKSSSLLLRGLQLSFDLSDDINFEHFISLANRYKTGVERLSRYWVLLAAFDQKYGLFNSSFEYYQRALAINPASRDALNGINAIKKAGVLR